MASAMASTTASTIRVAHDAGFFSCCSVTLNRILSHAGANGGELPIVDARGTFGWYKPPGGEGRDGRELFFRRSVQRPGCRDVPSAPVRWVDWDEVDDDEQFCDMARYNFAALAPVLAAYFTPDAHIDAIQAALQSKYGIDCQRTCVLFYRGNDKARESVPCDYGEMVDRALAATADRPDTAFWLQSDETEFLSFAFERLTRPGRSPTVMDGGDIRHMSRRDGTVDHLDRASNFEYACKFLAIVRLMARCRQVVCTSGNVSSWVALFRGSARGMVQHLAPREFMYGVRNVHFAPPHWIVNS